MPQTRSVSWSLVVTRHPGQSELRARRGRVSTRGASERVFDRQGLHSTAVHGGSSANASRRNPASGRLAKPDRARRAAALGAWSGATKEPGPARLNKLQHIAVQPPQRRIGIANNKSNTPGNHNTAEQSRKNNGQNRIPARARSTARIRVIDRKSTRLNSSH